MVRGIAVTVSGTSIDFTGIPSLVKRITVMFNGVSTNGSSIVQIQLGSGTIQNSSYSSVASGFASSLASTITISSGFATGDSSAPAMARYGLFSICNISSNMWAVDGGLAMPSIGKHIGSGGVTLAGTLDRVRITTVNGTDTFDAGTINILYEG